jgi:hypothetical protein
MTGQPINLDAYLSLKPASAYAAHRRDSDFLPLVYGDLDDDTAQAEGGLWWAVCVDSSAHVYALAGHALLSLAAGNRVSLYDAGGQLIPESAYALDLAHDYQGLGTIATATFAAEAQALEPIAVAAKGKPDASGALLANPLAVVRDILASAAGLGEEGLDPSAYTRAWSRAQALGWRAAGVVAAPVSAASLLTQIMGDFLGSWWLGADGRLKLCLDLGPGSIDEGELATVLSQAHLKNVSVTAKLANLVNRARVSHRYNPLRGQYAALADGRDSENRSSISLHGLAERQVGLAWARDPQTAARVGERLVALLGSPRRVITCEEDALVNLHLERGDAALVSLDWLGDELGRPLVNQIVRVLALEPQLDQGTIRFTLLDTGFCKTIAETADGSLTAQGPALAGGARDRKEYQP